MTEQLKIRQDGALLEITLVRPEKKNALSNAMYRRRPRRCTARRRMQPSAPGTVPEAASSQAPAPTARPPVFKERARWI